MSKQDCCHIQLSRDTIVPIHNYCIRNPVPLDCPKTPIVLTCWESSVGSQKLIKFIVCQFLFVSVFELQHSNISLSNCGKESWEAVYRISWFKPSDWALCRLISLVYFKNSKIEKYGTHEELTFHTRKQLVNFDGYLANIHDCAHMTPDSIVPIHDCAYAQSCPNTNCG